MPASTGGGLPRKPLPRKKIPADLRSLARAHTALCIKVLGRDRRPRGHTICRAPQSHTAEDGDYIRVTIRQIVEGSDED